jgi:hypothetical protein
LNLVITPEAATETVAALEKTAKGKRGRKSA